MSTLKDGLLEAHTWNLTALSWQVKGLALEGGRGLREAVNEAYRLRLPLALLVDRKELEAKLGLS